MCSIPSTLILGLLYQPVFEIVSFLIGHLDAKLHSWLQLSIFGFQLLVSGIWYFGIGHFGILAVGILAVGILALDILALGILAQGILL